MSGALQIAEIGRHPTALVLALSGDLTLRSTADLTDVVMAAVDNTHPHVVIDMSGVPYCDSSGLNSLIALYRSLNSTQRTLTLAAVPERLSRLLAVTGVDRLLPQHPTVESALAHIPAD